MKSIKRNLHLLQSENVVGPTNPDLVKLAGLIRAHTPHDGAFALRIPGVHVTRASRTNTKLIHVIQKPGFCIVAQA